MQGDYITATQTRNPGFMRKTFCCFNNADMNNVDRNNIIQLNFALSNFEGLFAKKAEVKK